MSGSIKISNEVLLDMNQRNPFSTNPLAASLEQKIKNTEGITIEFNLDVLLSLYAVDAITNPVMIIKDDGMEDFIHEEAFKDILKYVNTQKITRGGLSENWILDCIELLEQKLESYLQEGMSKGIVFNLGFILAG